MKKSLGPTWSTLPQPTQATRSVCDGKFAQNIFNSADEKFFSRQQALSRAIFSLSPFSHFERDVILRR